MRLHSSSRKTCTGPYLLVVARGAEHRICCAMTVKGAASNCMQSPLSVLDFAAFDSDSPTTAFKPQTSLLGLPPRASQSSSSGGQRSSVDPYASSDRINFSIGACKPVLTVCPNSPTRPKHQSRSRLRTARLSRSSSLNDSKVCCLLWKSAHTL